MKNSDILSREEIISYLARNNREPQLGVPQYVCWSAPQSLAPQRQNLTALHPADTYNWRRSLRTRKFKIMRKGEKEARLVMRVAKVKTTWTEIPLNGRG